MPKLNETIRESLLSVLGKRKAQVPGQSRLGALCGRRIYAIYNCPSYSSGEHEVVGEHYEMESLHGENLNRYLNRLPQPNYAIRAHEANAEFFAGCRGYKPKLQLDLSSNAVLVVWKFKVSREKWKLEKLFKEVCHRHAKPEHLEPKHSARPTYTPEVMAFCKQHGILAHVDEAKSLVEESFPSRKAVDVRLDNDPEEEGQWVVIEVSITQDIDDFFKAYDHCVDLWVKKLPDEALSLIRLSYHLA